MSCFMASLAKKRIRRVARREDLAVRRMLLVLIVLGLGCVSPMSNNAWKIGRQSKQQFAWDKQDCLRQTPLVVLPSVAAVLAGMSAGASQQPRGATTGQVIAGAGAGSATSTATHTQPDKLYFATCMEARGWEREWYSQ